jgi:hypothetical protein
VRRVWIETHGTVRRTFPIAAQKENRSTRSNCPRSPLDMNKIRPGTAAEEGKNK